MRIPPFFTPIKLPPPGDTLIIGAILAVSGFQILAWLQSLVDGSYDWRQLSTVGGTLFWFGLLALSWWAWKAGGFKAMKNLSILAVLAHVREGGLYLTSGLGAFLKGLGTAGSFVLVLSLSFPSAPPPVNVTWLAWGIALCFMIGGSLAIPTKGKEETLTWRSARLETTLKEVKKKVTMNHDEMQVALAQLLAFESDLSKRQAALMRQRVETEELARELGGDPSKIAAVLAFLRRSTQSATRQTWLAAIFGALVALIATPLLGWDRASLASFFSAINGWLGGALP